MGKKTTKSEVDVVLIGAGIMSATLGTLINELSPDINIEIIERLDVVAAESSDAWNNAGTGHSALCELNYTPEKPDGSIAIDKAIQIAESFEISKQFWASLVEKDLISMPGKFIRTIPHMSFVLGDANVSFLKKRYEKMEKSHLFKGMSYSEDFNLIKKWIPLVMEGRPETEKVAATRMEIGTDVKDGDLTPSMLRYLWRQEGVQPNPANEVQDIEKKNGLWETYIKN